MVPLWKKKGDKKDKNTWRGVTLLSVGTKLMARLVANRLARWTDPWLHESQTGFRGGRGTDDAQQVSRRIAEELARTMSDEVVLLRFFDIEKAYPRVCKDAMWAVLERRGCPREMIKVLKAIHEHTGMKVKYQGDTSSEYLPDRGLREGCPSSPILFNIYHDAVMQDFRTRREVKAKQEGWQPGIEWEYKIDGKLRKRQSERRQQGRDTETIILGDFGYADDTGIVGEAEEVHSSEKIFAKTLQDWEEKVHPGKTEGIRVSGTGKAATDVRNQGEAEAVKHVGGWVAENGRPFVKTRKRKAEAHKKLTAARTWMFGGSRIRREACNIKRSVRLTITKAVVIPTALASCRTRAWDENQITTMQQVQGAALRRCFGVKYSTLHEHHVSNNMLRKAAGWPTMKNMIMKAALTWLGHVARMKTARRPKQMLFGWKKGCLLKPSIWGAQTTWLNKCLKYANIPEGDWFRRAQDRGKWRNAVSDAFPVRVLSQKQKKELDEWKPGQRLPDNAPDEVSHSDLEEEAGDQGEDADEDNEAKAGQTVRYQCWVCDRTFEAGNQLKFHYEECHAICDPTLVTTLSFQCTSCMEYFPRVEARNKHICPAKQPIARLHKVDTEGDPADVAPGEAKNPEFRHIYTDGSGGGKATGQGGLHVYSLQCQKGPRYRTTRYADR